MPAPASAPFGSWPSPIHADFVAGQRVRLGDLHFDQRSLYWVESRPAEQGRAVIVHQAPDGQITDRTPPNYSARTRAQEYGGGAFTVHHGTLFFVNQSDQRIYVQQPEQAPQPLTAQANVRFAEGHQVP